MSHTEENKIINKLVIDAQNGDSDAVDELFKRLTPLRYSLAKKFSNKGVEFEDITQQIDLKLTEAIYDYEASKDPSALRHLKNRVKNGIWNFYRKEMNYFNKDKEMISLDEVRFRSDDGSGEKIFDLYSTLIANGNGSFDEDKIIERLALEDELSRLTPHQKEVLLMCFIDDMTQYDIAESLQINQSNVSRAKKRGIEMIKECVIPLDEQSDSS